MKKICLVVATTNLKKHQELALLLSDLPLEVKPLAQFPGIREVRENGMSFLENAERKALGYAQQTGCLALAEDSGLCVDYLKGAPGIYSARFAGEERDDLNNCQKVLELLQDVPDRKRRATFKCVAAIATPAKVLAVVEEEVGGRIAHQMRGRGGFGYDPLFFYPRFGKTFAEMRREAKDAVSHRGKALRKIKEFLRDYLEHVPQSERT